MKIWIVYRCELQDGTVRRISEDHDVKSSEELEYWYKQAQEWCNDRNKELIFAQWDWRVELGEYEECGIDAMLLLVIFEMVEDVLKIWKKENMNVLPFE